MNLTEFSDNFDTLLASYSLQAGFGSTDNPAAIELDEYEKSVLLTKSEQETVISLYTGRNETGLSFEETEEMRRYLSSIVEEASLAPIETSNGKPLGIDSKSKFFTLPDNLWYITYESVTISDGKCENASTMEVVPVTQDEYHRVRKNPFRGPNDRRSLRLDLSDNIIEIVSKYTVTKYYVRYLRKIKPIILVNLPDGLTIEGTSTATPCELHESLHQRILERAVQMAVQSRSYTTNNNKRE